MTLSIAWIRQVKGCEELVFASDSRMCGGMRWDQCPKNFTLPRTDAAISFAGDTMYVYPLIHQLISAISSYRKSTFRGLDIHDLRGYVINVFDEMYSTIKEDQNKEGIKTVELILGGYSWIRKKFSFWKIYYNHNLKKFTYKSPSRLIGKFKDIIFAGDWALPAKKTLVKLLKERWGNQTENFTDLGFDFEPFEILRDFLRKANDADTIGGAPQIIKVYQYMQTATIGVYWPSKKSNTITLLGRKLMSFENPDNWILDPDTFISSQKIRQQKKIEEEVYTISDVGEPTK